jgi:hypothetical protein
MNNPASELFTEATNRRGISTSQAAFAAITHSWWIDGLKKVGGNGKKKREPSRKGKTFK